MLDLTDQDHALAQKRIKAGLAQARAAGKQLSRARTDRSAESAIRRASVEDDRGIHKVATEFGVGTGTVQRIKSEIENVSEVAPVIAATDVG